MESEVVVVGAGPAGSMAAIVLAQQGHDVILLDRQTFPRDKICGDAVPGPAMSRLLRYGMKKRIDSEVAKGHFHPVSKMLLVAPHGRSVVTPFELDSLDAYAHVVPRIHLDAAIQAHAIESGARFIQGQVSAPIIENGAVVGVKARIDNQNETIKCRAVIAADGVTSVIARALRPEHDEPQNRHRAIALRAYIEDLDQDPERIEFYLYKEILPGYAWIFPTGKHSANIGLGMRLDKFRDHDKTLKEMLDYFLTFPDIAPRLMRGGVLSGIKTWQLNFGSQKMQLAFDGAVLVGDAASLINPLTGGGIDNAMVSGELAAKTIHKALAGNDLSRAALKPYETLTHEELYSGMRTSYFLQRTLLRFPRLIDFLVASMGSSSTFTKTFLSKM